MSQTQEKIAIIMRSYNDAGVIQGTLEMLSRQTWREFELWNFDSGSSDGTLEIIRKFNHADRILLNDSTNYNPGRVLNEAVETVDADILVFLNSDATPQDEHWLERLVEPLHDPTIGAVFGRQIARPDCRSLFAKDTERAFGNGSETSRWVHFFSMANSAARRSVFRHFPFETAISYSEDIEWSYRLRRGGYRIRYVTDAVAIHSHNYTLKQSYTRQYGEGKAEAFIFREGEFDYSLARYFLMPLLMESIRDMRWAFTKRSLDAALHSVPLRLTQKWARWRGARAGWKKISRSLPLPGTCPSTFTLDGNEAAEARIAMDQSLINIYVADAIPEKNFEALVLMGGYGRGEGGYHLRADLPAPYNDYDYFVIVKNMGHKDAKIVEKQLKTLAERLSVIVGVEVDLAVLRRESLSNAPFTLMNAEMKWGHRVLSGNPRVLDAMPAMPFDKLTLGEFTRLMNNRGTLLLMNAQKLGSGCPLKPEERDEFFKFLSKAILACGDALLALKGVYHPSYVEKVKRLAFLGNPPDRKFIELYKQAVEQKFYPDSTIYKNENLNECQRLITNYWLDTFSVLEAHRMHCSIRTWREYARPWLSKGQLEASHFVRNFAITLRDFGARHTLRYPGWALRYPRERLISVLPLLLKPASGKIPSDVTIALAAPPHSSWVLAVERYLKTWERYA